ncbi:hypothetical protein AWB75_07052 [Caballeronia catudaia]|uniref:Uncharacterized protein n=1 Tax=Caballeronia catudaia TaxID=1777136 RepID=A0A158DRM6_9BURK|nr:hypothetical protein AWB75_07052 [Caballeronia catudaia]
MKKTAVVAGFPHACAMRNVHQIFPADARGSAGAQGSLGFDRYRDGRNVRSGWKQSVEEVHGRGRAAPDESSNVVSGNGVTGPIRNRRSSTGEVPGSRRDDRAGLAVTPATRYPLFERAGREAGALWLQFAQLSAAEFRELRFRNLVSGFGHLPDFAACRAAFDDAFARSIALDIATASRAEVRHG